MFEFDFEKWNYFSSLIQQTKTKMGFKLSFWKWTQDFMERFY